MNLTLHPRVHQFRIMQTTHSASSLAKYSAFSSKKKSQVIPELDSHL